LSFETATSRGAVAEEEGGETADAMRVWMDEMFAASVEARAGGIGIFISDVEEEEELASLVLVILLVRGMDRRVWETFG